MKCFPCKKGKKILNHILLYILIFLRTTYTKCTYSLSSNIKYFKEWTEYISYKVIIRLATLGVYPIRYNLIDMNIPLSFLIFLSKFWSPLDSHAMYIYQNRIYTTTLFFFCCYIMNINIIYLACLTHQIPYCITLDIIMWYFIWFFLLYTCILLMSKSIVTLHKSKWNRL